MAKIVGMSDSSMNPEPRVGVALILKKGDKILMGKRRGSHGAGTWCFPGGHLEYGEEIEDCARRELLEETGLTVKEIRQGTFTNDIFSSENKHYITIFAFADYVSGEPKIMEPEKCDGWGWFEWKKLPKPLFLGIENLIKRKFNPFEY